MTTEVAVLNRSAIALAADSFATVRPLGVDEPDKTYLVSKLFTLSKHHPVAVMVWGGAEFLNVPWETVIKAYRKHLGLKAFSTVVEYAEDFLVWIAASPGISAEDSQQEWFSEVVGGFYGYIDGLIDKRVKEYVGEGGTISLDAIASMVGSVVESQHARLSNSPPRYNLPDSFQSTLVDAFSAQIDELMERQLGRKPLSSLAIGQLKDMAALLFSRENNIPNVSGIVVAGFGEAEFFPVVHSCKVFGAINEKTIISRDDGNCVSAGTSAVVPFAQRDVADTLLLGVDSDAIDTIARYQEQVFSRLPQIITEAIDLDENVRKRLTDQLTEAAGIALETFRKALDRWQHERHVEPLLRVLQVLPKEELAEIAESLVSITSLKRKISTGIATVGGPIDVAVISKGDGSVWIKRKHYFSEELNPTFIPNYFER